MEDTEIETKKRKLETEDDAAEDEVNNNANHGTVLQDQLVKI